MLALMYCYGYCMGCHIIPMLLVTLVCQYSFVCKQALRLICCTVARVPAESVLATGRRLCHRLTSAAAWHRTQQQQQQQQQGVLRLLLMMPACPGSVALRLAMVLLV
jgi:hypothetical protein